MWYPGIYSRIPRFGTPETKVDYYRYLLFTRDILDHELRPGDLELGKGAFKYYVIKEVGGWGQKMAIFDDLQYC